MERVNQGELVNSELPGRMAVKPVYVCGLMLTSVML